MDPVVPGPADPVCPLCNSQFTGPGMPARDACLRRQLSAACIGMVSSGINIPLPPTSLPFSSQLLMGLNTPEHQRQSKRHMKPCGSTCTCACDVAAPTGVNGPGSSGHIPLLESLCPLSATVIGGSGIVTEDCTLSVGLHVLHRLYYTVTHRPLMGHGGTPPWSGCNWLGLSGFDITHRFSTDFPLRSPPWLPEAGEGNGTLRKRRPQCQSCLPLERPGRAEAPRQRACLESEQYARRRAFVLEGGPGAANGIRARAAVQGTIWLLVRAAVPETRCRAYAQRY